MPDTEAHDDLMRLQEQLRIDSHSIEDAKQGWKLRRTALIDGLGLEVKEASAKERVAHHNRYMSIARYCDEARELLAQYGGQDRPDPQPPLSATKKIFVIDPHVMSAYCEFWDPGSHKGFEFLKAEIPKTERLDYQLFVYSSLLNGMELALLDSARPDISKTVSFFVEEHSQRRSDNRKAREILQHLKDATLAIKFEPNVEKQIEFIHQKAVNLAMSVAGTAERQSLALARLKKLMTKGRFFVPEAMVRSHLSAEQRQASRYSRLVQAFRSKRSLANDSHQDLTNAYRSFRELTEVGHATGLEKSQRGLIRGGEQVDLNIIHEVHMLNSALRICDIDAEFVYVTLSSRLYSFLSAFKKKDVLCPVLHPRTALVYQENRLAQDQRMAMETALSGPIAYGRGIPKDKFIRPTEMDAFEQQMTDVLKVTREAFTYSAVTQTDGIDHFLDAFSEVFRLSDDPAAKAGGEDILKTLEADFGDVAESVGKAYSYAIDKGLSEETWEAYEQFSANLSNLSDQRIAIREYESGPDSKRFTVIPLTRGFRHMFVLHNSFLGDELSAHVKDGITQMSMGKLLKVVTATVDKELAIHDAGSELHAKSRATKFFARSCYAACNGEWNLVQSTANDGLAAMQPVLQDIDCSTLSATQARAVLIRQELSFMLHLSERALAESSANAGVHSSRMIRAAKALHDSSYVTVSLPKKYAAFATPFSAMSIREGLAAVGLTIEWLLKGRWRQLTSRDQTLPPLLHATDNIEVAWWDIDWLSEEISRHQLEDSELLISASETLLERAKLGLAWVENNPEGGHGIEIWRYLVLRASAMVMMTRQAFGFLIGDEYSGIGEERLDEIERVRGDHIRFFTREVDGNNYQIDHNPFTEGLIAIEQYVLATFLRDDGLRDVADLPRALNAFAEIDRSCSDLYRFGFPRMYLRQAKEILIGPILDNLKSTYIPR